MIFYFVNLTTTPQGFSMNNRHQKKSGGIASCVLFIFSLLHFATYFELFIALFEK